MTEPWPVAIEAAGPVSVGTILWRFAGQLRVTVVCKATLALVPGEDMRVDEPLEVRRTEVHGNDDPRRSIVAPSDLAPRLVRCDVFFVGHAYAPRGQEAKSVPVRLVVARPGGGDVMLDKRLEVIGDRLARPGEAPSEPKPFARMPLVYERAYGGIGWADNPLGTGTAVDVKGMLRVPNVIHPPSQGGGVNPPGFAPLARAWPVRRRLLGGLDPRTVEGLVTDLPETLDWNYFQAAPLDQRIDFVTGEEYILLEGLHSRHPVLRTRFPGLAAQAMVVTSEGIQLPLTLRADTLAIFGDAERVSVTWRGNFPVPDANVAASLNVVVTLVSRGEVVALPEKAPMSTTQVLEEPAPARKPIGNDLVGTITLGDEDLVVAEGSDVARLLRAPPPPPPKRGAPPPPAAGAPWPSVLASPASLTGTLDMRKPPPAPPSNPDADPLARTESSVPPPSNKPKA